MTTTVTSVLGDTREAKTYEDGSYNCPFCSNCVRPEWPDRDGRRCSDPRCPASRHASVDHAREVERKRQEALEAEAHERQRWDSMRQYQAEREQARAAEKVARLAEADQHGYCPVCICGYHAKRVRHRKPENCPRPRFEIVVPTRRTER